MKINRSLLLKYFIIWLVACTIGCYFRLYPLLFFKSLESQEKATMVVIAQIRNQVKGQITRQYANLPQEQQDLLIKKSLEELIRKQKKEINIKIDELAKGLESAFNNQRGYPYLLASDSYYYYDLTNQLVKNGSYTDDIKGSKYHNTMMLAPVGHDEPFTLHPYIGAFVYKCVKLFNPNASLMFGVSFTSVFLFILILIPFFWITHQLGCRPLAALTGAVFFSLIRVFIKRSTFAWYDNDPYSILFAFLIIGCVFYSVLQEHSKRKQIILAAVTAGLVMLYALFWQGWVFIFAMIAASFIGWMIYIYFIQKDKILFKHASVFFSIFISVFFIFISLIFGVNEFFILFSEGWKALTNFLNPQLSPWPDLFMSVGELQTASVAGFTELVGGYIPIILALLGLVVKVSAVLRSPRQTNPFPALLLGTLFGITTILSLGAQRFAFLCVIPLSLLMVVGLEFIIQTIDRCYTKKPKSIQLAGKILVCALMLSITILPIRNAQTFIRKILNPIYNDTWNTVLTDIKEKTPSETIVNTWWPPGHFIKAIAERRVTFDGATINFPQAYWLANVFLSETETEALGLLRMINNSANQAAEYLTEDIGLKLSTSVKLLKVVTKLNDYQARLLLSKALKNPDKVNHLLTLTHADPPPSCLFIYSDIAGENLIQYKLFGGWNFEKIEEINSKPEVIKQIPDRHSDGYINFLWALAGGPYKFSGAIAQVSKTNEHVLFDGVNCNLKTMECHVDSPQYGKGTVKSVFYIDGDQYVEKESSDGKLNYSAALMKNNNLYSVILLDTPLAKSMLIRLYYFDGVGLKYFSTLSKSSDLTKRTNILAYMVDWKKFQEDQKN